MAETTEIQQLAPDAQSAMREAMLGPVMKRLQMQRKSAFIDLEQSGRLKPATVLNFNPVPLVVDDPHVRWKVPAITDKNKRTLTVEYLGRKYTASYLTISNPEFVAWLRDVKAPAAEGEHPTPEYDAKYILPIELAHQYYGNYTSSQNPVGGVLVYEGGYETLIKSKTLRVANPVRLPNGSLTYGTREMDKFEALDAVLKMQKDHCTNMIQQGDEYNQDDQNRKNITPVHRAWLKYALDMGWKQNASEWMNSVLETEESCKGCGKGRTRSDAHFCACGRPYDPYKSFMAGENVPESYLYALDGKQQDDVMKELARRDALKAKFRPKP